MEVGEAVEMTDVEEEAVKEVDKAGMNVAPACLWYFREILNSQWPSAFVTERLYREYC
jgi:predicted GNAT family acetyltransferase